MSVEIVGRDKVGRIARDEDGSAFYVTECCAASAKGSMGAVVCRKCYRDIDPSLGGIPADEGRSSGRTLPGLPRVGA